MPTQAHVHAPRPPRLNVLVQQRRSVVLVQPEWAGDLRIYLRANGVMSEAPEMTGKDFVRVVLLGEAKPRAVQDLLDRWDSVGLE